jgi:NACHT domain
MQGSFPQAGFFYQNHIAARKLLELLEFGSPLRTITLENYSKGNHIDDIIIEYDNCAHYYQIKWSADDNTPYTIHNLITPQNDKPKSLIRELAEGYSKLRNKEHCEIILFSTKRASNQKRQKGGITKSLADFIEHIHLPFAESTEYTKLTELPHYVEYEAIIEKLRLASGLDQNTFWQFLKRLRFALSQGDKEEQREKIIHKMESLGIEQHLYETLLVAVVEWSISGKEIQAGDVLERLGLANRFVDRITHDFKVEEQYFIDNPRLFAQLDDAIASLPGGFILLEGPPGSGKSTYLTEYQKRRTSVKFAYYCFVPDEKVLGNPRLEKDTFLKSLCIGIRNSFPDIDFPEPYSQDYENKLLKWLYRLSELGSKIVFVIDGLDHVDKKKDSLKEPLTNYLDGDLPSNVFFILSSQYPEALAPGIQTQLLQDQRRHIKVKRFSEGEIQQFLERRGLQPSLKIVSLAASKSEGIPLYLYYIAILLTEAPPNEYQYEKILQELPSLENSKIDTYHEFLYQQVSKDELAVRALALLANRREFTSSATLVELLQLLEVQADILRVESICAKYNHLLRRTDAKGYTIFHNSFREFILRKTESLIEPINDALVTYYKNNPDNDETYRNFYRHLFELGSYQEILNDCDEQWLKRSWRAFRPFEEISSNLDLAWDAAVRLLSLKEFVRIAFLEQQFGRASFNFEWVEGYKPARFLLNINKHEEAIRRVWDGERVRIPANDFYAFVVDHFRKTGHLLPQRIAEAGFTQFKRRTTLGETIARFEARALYENWQSLFAEVTGYEWRSSDEHTHAVTVASKEENENTNNKIKRRVIDVLFLAKNYHSLSTITQEPHCPLSIKTHAALRASELLLEVDEIDEAVRFAHSIDFSLIGRSEYNRLIARFAEADSYHRIASLVPNKYSPPSLFEGLTKENLDFGIKDELLELYDNLRVYFLQNPADYRAYEIKANSFDSPERNFFTAIVELSGLWSDVVQGSLDSKAKLKGIKGILNELNIDYELRKKFSQDTYLHKDNFIEREIDKIYADITSFIASHLGSAYIPEIVSHWLVLDTGRNGYKNQRISLDFARTLHERQEQELRPTIISLLQRSESQARLDEETLILMASLVECAEGYGYCGFDSEAERLWNELFTLACGVYSRKDYQFSEAIIALEYAHKYHPENSPHRLVTLLTLAHQLWGAADGRAVARAIGDLINFSSSISPSLAFELLHKEEKSIFREEVIEALSNTLAKRAEIDLRYVWAIARTMDKWDNFHDYNDNTYPAMLSLFTACLERKDLVLAREIYEFARHQLLVEKEMPQRVYEFANKAQHYGIIFSSIEEDLQTFEDEWQQEVERKAQNDRNNLAPPEKRQKVKVRIPTFDEMHDLAEQDFSKFKDLLNEISKQYSYHSRDKDLKHAYSTLKETLSKILILSPPKRPEVIRENRYASIRRFAKFTLTVLGLQSVSEFKFKLELEQLFEGLLKEVCAPIFGDNWLKLIENNFDYREWLSKFAQRTYRPIYWFNHEVLDNNLLQLIEQSSLSNLSNWEVFCREHLSRYELTKALLTIAQRIKKINKKHSLALLHEAWNTNKDFFYMEGSETTNPYLNLLFELDAQKAKETLLEGFSHQYRRFPKDIVYHLDQILDHAHFFAESEIYEFIYTEYEQYNVKLTEGLVKKETNFEWIENFEAGQPFEASVVQYLLRLFDYPEVEIRKLSLSSLFDLIKANPALISIALKFGQTANENVTEHLLSLVYSVAIYDYNLVISHKKGLFTFLDTPHFNIRQTAKEILLHCAEQGGELDAWEICKLEIINVRPELIVSSLEEGVLQKGKRFIPSSYQTKLMHQLFVHHQDSNIQDKIYTKLLQLGWSSDSWMEKESAVHRAHNINTNFDTIEINGPYFKCVQKVLNETFVREIAEQKYENEAIDELKYEFRLYDPSERLIQAQIKSRPRNIDWIGPATSKDEFLEFKGMERCFSSFLVRDTEWVTLYEDGHQRTGNSDDRSGGVTTYFTIIPFLANKSIIPELDILFANYLPIPYYSTKNCYRHEIPNVFPMGSSYPSADIKPIIGISQNRFRGQHELSVAALLPDFLNELALSRDRLYSLNFHKDGEQMIDFLTWQQAYDQGRRRQKPKSAGVSLKIRTSLLKAYLQNNNYVVCFIVNSRRATDQYVPEKEMNWRSFQRIFPSSSEIDLMLH